MFIKGKTYSESFVSNFQEQVIKVNPDVQIETQGLIRIGHTIRININESIVIFVAIDFADEFIFECVYVSESFNEQLDYVSLLFNKQLLTPINTLLNENINNSTFMGLISLSLNEGLYIISLYNDKYFYINECEREFDIEIIYNILN